MKNLWKDSMSFRIAPTFGRELGVAIFTVVILVVVYTGVTLLTGNELFPLDTPILIVGSAVLVFLVVRLVIAATRKNRPAEPAASQRDDWS